MCEFLVDSRYLCRNIRPQPLSYYMYPTRADVELVMVGFIYTGYYVQIPVFPVPGRKDVEHCILFD